MRTRDKPKEYSKQWMTRWQIFSIIVISLYVVVDLIQSFTMDREIHIGELCMLMITSVIATIIPYFAKAYFGKRNEETTRLAEQREARAYGTIDNGEEENIDE